MITNTATKKKEKRGDNVSSRNNAHSARAIELNLTDILEGIGINLEVSEHPSEIIAEIGELANQARNYGLYGLHEYLTSPDQDSSAIDNYLRARKETTKKGTFFMAQHPYAQTAALTAIASAYACEYLPDKIPLTVRRMLPYQLALASLSGKPIKDSSIHDNGVRAMIRTHIDGLDELFYGKRCGAGLRQKHAEQGVEFALNEIKDAMVLDIFCTRILPTYWKRPDTREAVKIFPYLAGEKFLETIQDRVGEIRSRKRNTSQYLGGTIIPD